jgi:hypothetical protein
MILRYLGTGTISIEGFGEVSAGDTLGVSDELGRKLIEERPEQFEEAGDAAPAPSRGTRSKKRGGD